MGELLKHARENHYAVGYFESWNLESLLSVIDAAKRAASPVIIGFGGMFLANPERRVEEDIYHYGAMGLGAAASSDIPMALLLNEADRVDMIIKALKAGFNAVMYQDLNVDFDKTVEINKYIVKTAHYCGADVEAEVGCLPDADAADGSIKGGETTDPDKAAYFVRETGIDALAIAVGNVHLLEGRTAELDFGLIKELRDKIDIPLVLHGGTGISAEALGEAIDIGVCKLNVGTILKRIYIDHIKKYLDDTPVGSYNPQEIVGKGGKLDFLCSAREEMACEIVSFMKKLRSINMAKKM